MVSLSREVSFFERSALTLLKGKKVDGGTSRQAPKFVEQFSQLLQKMHQFHLTAPEPDSYVRSRKYYSMDKGGKLLGETHIHPVSQALYQDAEHLKSICILKNQSIAEFEVLGLDWEKRKSWKDARDFKTDKIAILAAGDIVSLWQGMSLIRQREDGIKGKPVIIQNTNGIWDSIFNPSSPRYNDDKKKLEKLGIYLSSGAPETADLLARFTHLPKIEPKYIHFNYGVASHIKNPLYLFATTDDKKFKEVKAGLAASGASARIRKVIHIFGKSEIPEEERHSYEGNAAEKMEALIKRIRELGSDVVEKLLKSHGYNDVSEVILMTNDGGLGFCLENANGDREKDIFTPEFFPNTHQKMNKTQMAPGVELAYLMRTIGLETAFAQMWKSVKSIVRRSKGKFKDSDLRAYDTSLQMSVPLSRVLDAIKNNQPTDLESLDVMSVFSGQRLKVSETPKGPTVNGVETINYLMTPDKPKVRAERSSDIPFWPNAMSINLLQKFIGTDAANAPHIARAKDEHKNAKVSMGLLATPALFFANSASPLLSGLKKKLLEQFHISTTNSGNDWNKYKDSSVDDITLQATQGASNSAYRAGIRRLLDKCSQTVRLMDDDSEPDREQKKISVFYIGEQRSYSNSMHVKIIQLLSFFTAVVRNQTFEPVNFVANRQAIPFGFKLLEHKKRLGLIGQEINQLVTAVDSEEDAAEAISKIVKGDNYKVTPTDKKFKTDGQTENKQCMTATVYFSASNVNNRLVKEAQRLAYLLAVNGMSMKVGGGNEGLMRAAADGFQRGKRELQAKGHDFPNQLILVQCTGTESIEKRYDGGGIYRCHPTIEAREADLQNSDFVIAGAGGAGTDEEIIAEFYSRDRRLINPANKPLVLYNQQIQTARGMEGVHDPYKDEFSAEFMKSMNTSFALTAEEIIAQAFAHRAQMQKSQQVIRFDTLRQRMKEFTEISEGHRAVGTALADKRFVQPYGLFTGAEGKVPAANDPAFKELKVA